MNKSVIKSVGKEILSQVLTPVRPGNIAMLHVGRCGSTVLGSLLNQHKRMYWASEFFATVFTEWERNNEGREVVGQMQEDAIILLKENMKKALHRYYGFEIKPFHFRLIGYSSDSFMDHLDDLGYQYYIHLDRKNKMRKIISSIIAHEDKKQYHQSGSGRVKLKQVHVNIHKIEIDFETKSLIEFLSDYDRQTDEIKSLLKNRNHLSLTYEKDIQEDPREGYQKICDFIGMKQKEVAVKLKRTNPFPVKDMIANLDEVQKALKGSDYEWMLYN